MNLRIEVLEDRAVPAIVVNTLEDTTAIPGQISLRDAIAEINDDSDDEIDFDFTSLGYSPPYHVLIGIKTALPAIEHDVLINGIGEIDVGRAPIDPDNPEKFRIFEVGAGVTATFVDIGVLNGDVIGDGGGILNNGTLYLDHCKVFANGASGSGGGIMNTNLGMVTIDTCTIINNTGAADGGGVASNGALGVYTATIKDNMATGQGGGLYYASGDARTATIQLSSIWNNTAGQEGGGMYLVGGGGATNFVISDSWVDGNKSTGAQKKGGGLFLDEGSFNITDSTISRNSAKDDGGGLYADNNALLQVTNTTFNGNETQANGGGVALHPSLNQQLSFTHCTFSWNWSTDYDNGQGGGVYIASESGGSLVLTDCYFNNNGAVYGGGLYTERPTEIYGGQFSSNTAGVAGGGMYGGKADALLRGYGNQVGVIFNDNSAPEGMGPGIAWEQNGGGTIDYVISGNNNWVDYV